MKDKAFNLLLFMVFFTSHSKAQDLAINGYIFCNDSSVVEAVPFATVKYYDYNNPKKLEYIDFTDLSGRYSLGEHVVQKDYHIVIEAPGYQRREKNIGNLPKSYEGGNITFHFQLQKSGKPLPALAVYAAETMTGAHSLSDAILQVPAVEKLEGTDVLSKDGGTIRVLINGFSLTPEKLGMLGQFPLEILKEVQYYDLKEYGTPYDGVVNMVMIDGDMAGVPDFTPGETSFYDK